MGYNGRDVMRRIAEIDTHARTHPEDESLWGELDYLRHIYHELRQINQKLTQG